MAGDGVLADPVAERERLARLEEEQRRLDEQRRRLDEERRAEIERRAARARPAWVRAGERLRRGAGLRERLPRLLRLPRRRG